MRPPGGLGRLTKLSTDRFGLLLALFGVLGTALILTRVHHGVGVNGDAKYYIEVARALAEGGRGGYVNSCVNKIRRRPSQASCL